MMPLNLVLELLAESSDAAAPARPFFIAEDGAIWPLGCPSSLAPNLAVLTPPSPKSMGLQGKALP